MTINAQGSATADDTWISHTALGVEALRALGIQVVFTRQEPRVIPPHEHCTSWQLNTGAVYLTDNGRIHIQIHDISEAEAHGVLTAGERLWMDGDLNSLGFPAGETYGNGVRWDLATDVTAKRAGDLLELQERHERESSPHKGRCGECGAKVRTFKPDAGGWVCFRCARSNKRGGAR